jgi:voltage-gated potassium channel
MLKKKIYDIIFFSDSPAGKWFDILLIWSIVLSVVVVMLDSVEGYSFALGDWFFVAEWFFTIIFTFEYLTRVWVSQKPLKYIFSFFGLIDLFSIVPTYLSLFLPGTQYLTVIRILRVLRIFRILKLAKFIGETQLLKSALIESRRKIFVFLMAVLFLAIIIGSLMYIIEGSQNGFHSIPKSIYWAIVTMTTVGYGDMAPSTPGGQFLASIIMIMGYAIIAVPTGIVTVGITNAQNKKDGIIRECGNCGHLEPDSHAKFCKMCAESL